MNKEERFAEWWDNTPGPTADYSLEQRAFFAGYDAAAEKLEEFRDSLRELLEADE